MEYSTVLVIGNGFDINLGLETSYKSFLERCDKFNGQANVGDMYLFKHLKKQFQIDNWIDLELELKKYDFSEKNPKESFSYLEECITDYLRKSQINANYLESKRDSQAFKLLEQVVKLGNFIILNFNYTNTAIQILKFLGLKESEILKKHLSVHGTIFENNIVVGVDEDFDRYKELPFLIKTNNVRYRHNDVSEIMNNSKNIIFFGHSLGKTDHSHFDKFFMDSVIPLNSNFKQKRSINIFYYGEEDWYNKTVQLANLTNRKFTNIRNNFKFEKIDIKENGVFPNLKDLMFFDDYGWGSIEVRTGR
jgi:hypothetical protein